MFSRLHLTHFKNFADAELRLGPLTVLVGTNASGKSNVREAFRFLHGLSRGYELAEILGEKWIEGGSLVWKGIRGGAREVAFQGEKRFGIEAELVEQTFRQNYSVEIEIDPRFPNPLLYSESLAGGPEGLLSAHVAPGVRGRMQVMVDGRSGNQYSRSRAAFLSRGNNQVLEVGIGSMRFLDLVPEALRIPSLPGQTILGDRGENLSSVLLSICEDPATKHALLEWLRELTPLDVTDFHFDSGPDGKVLVAFVESDGRRTSALSASDGTLRFLAMAAAMISPDSSGFYFIEEIDNGIHPTRLHLLVKLIEQHTRDGRIQVVATTHSPQLLSFLSEESREHASLVYRLSGQPGARIKRIMDLPDIARILKTQDLARLHAAGWMEDAVALTEADASQPEGAE